MNGDAPGSAPDRFLTVEAGPEVETKVKGSRFIAGVQPIARPEDVAEVLARLRKRHRDATHHCVGWRLGPPESPRERFDDDGEPSGTAGAPILAAVRGEELFDALCVVTRYYGGTKLGTGGLVRAYGDAARAALARCTKVWIERLETLRLELPYDALGTVEASLARENAFLRGVERRFEPEPQLTLKVLRSHAARLADRLIDASAGRVRVTRESASCERGGSS